ncbi:1059_t:CDS:2, partial [Paraglomus occultum]
MRRTFPANSEQQFDEAYRKANLVCSKAELPAYNNRPNKHGSPRRLKNAFFIPTRRTMIIFNILISTTTQSRDVIRHAGQAWQRLSAGERRVYVLAASVVEKKFYEDNPGYVYNPRRGPLETVSATATTDERRGVCRAVRTILGSGGHYLFHKNLEWVFLERTVDS